jgi:hypothetical protein
MIKEILKFAIGSIGLALLIGGPIFYYLLFQMKP